MTVKRRRDPNNKPPKPIKIKPQRIQNMDIAVPKLEYKVVAQPILETRFTGHVTALPTVLIFYLNSHELRIAAAILQETMECGECVLTVSQLGKRLTMTGRTVSDALYNLRRMGVLFEENDSYQIKRAIDLRTVQHLNDLVSIEDRGIYRRLRRVCKFKHIFNITRQDLERAYDRHVLPPDHDIEEEEEYD